MSPSPATARPDSGLSVATVYYDDGKQSGFFSDCLASLREAHAAGDDEGVDRIWNLWNEYFEHHLPSLGFSRLVEKLEAYRIWRRHDGWPVFKTADPPCIAFTASIAPEEKKITLVALGLCYRYPENDAERWWQAVILPRLKTI